MRQWLRLSGCRWLLVAVMIFATGCFRPANIQTAGGVVLVYQTSDGADGKPTALTDAKFQPLAKVILARLKSLGFPAATVEQDGPNRLRISVVGADEFSIPAIKQLLADPGRLELRILANGKDHAELIAAARQSPDREVTQGDEIGRWVKIRHDPANTPRGDFVCPLGSALRNAKTQAAIELDDDEWRHVADGGPAAQKIWQDHGVEELEVLVVREKDPTWNFSGRHFASVEKMVDETGRPCVGFATTDDGATVLHTLTTVNAPDLQTEHYRHLGVVYNDELRTAPRLMSPIGDRGQVTGNFTEDEVAHMVAMLRAGELPIPLADPPVSADVIPAAH